MPFPNEHAARLINPKSLDSIRVRRTKGSGKGKVKGVVIPKTIDVIWFIIRRDKKEVPVAQTLRFPTKDWTKEAARKWLKDNKVKPILFEEAKPKDKKEVQKVHKEFHALWEMEDDSLELISHRGAIKKGHDLIAEEMIRIGMEHGSVLILDNVKKNDEEQDEVNILEIMEHIFLEEEPKEEPEEEQDKEVFEFNSSIAKVDTEEKMVYGVVLEPDTLDAQKDFIKPEEVRKTAHDFLENTQKIGFQHEDFKKKFKIMESYIVPEDFNLGTVTVKKGSWVMAVRVISKDVWKKVKKGEITGFSVGGKGARVYKD